MTSQAAGRIAVAPSTPNEKTSPVLSSAVLDTWSSYDWSQGLDLATVTPGAVLEVVTTRSVYYILAPAAGATPMQVRGGQYLPEFRSAKAIGCTLGGALLKQNAVHVGFRMELTFEDIRLITSPVLSTRVLRETAE